jgi:hypothetical protein
MSNREFWPVIEEASRILNQQGVSHDVLLCIGQRRDSKGIFHPASEVNRVVAALVAAGADEDDLDGTSWDGVKRTFPGVPERYTAWTSVCG